jgi:RNA polymerase sigma-70 factor, ECF subfamily
MNNRVAEASPEVSVRASQQIQDWTLIRRSQAGDTDAFDELITKYRTRIFNMVYRMVRNEHDALDLTQEGFLKACRAIHVFKARASFYTWLYSLTMNIAIDHSAVRDSIRR